MKKIVESLKFIFAVLAISLTPLLAISLFATPEQTKENTFDWNGYESARIEENIAKIERDFTGGFYVTGKVVSFCYSPDKVVIVPENDEERLFPAVLLVTIPKKDVANLKEGDIITVYNKFEVGAKGVMGASGRLIEVKGGN